MMGFLSGVASACRAVGSFVSSVASSVGSAVSSFAKKLVTTLPEISILTEVVVAVVKAIAEGLGLIDKEDTTEELGAKAIESEKKLEDFSSTREYIEHLRNEVELDTEKFNNMEEKERLGCSAIGVSILSKGIEEEEDLKIPEDFWVEVGRQKMKVDEVKAYIEKFKENNLTQLNLGDYLKGKLSVKENKEVYPVIKDTLQELNPELADEDIEDKIFEMEDLSRGNERG